MIEVTCPKCEAEFKVKSPGGRPPKNIDVSTVCDKLQATRSVKRTAEELECSRGYVYKVLKEEGRIAREIIIGQT